VLEKSKPFYAYSDAKKGACLDCVTSQDVRLEIE
jgi:hypothetical protein